MLAQRNKNFIFKWADIPIKLNILKNSISKTLNNKIYFKCIV